jgi:hypothetical protein
MQAPILEGKCGLRSYFPFADSRIGMIGAVQLEGLILAPAAIPATLTNNLTLAFPKPTKPNPTLCNYSSY